VAQGGEAPNRLSGRVEPPRPEDLLALPVPGSEEHALLEARGLQALREGKVALCVLAGGMATRMGSVVKALVEAVPGFRFLDVRLAEHDRLRAQGARVPLWLMTSQATEGPLRSALGSRLEGEEAEVATFEQGVSLRLTREGSLFRDEQGEPSVYATGHGDLPEALRRSGLLQRFRAQGGELVWIANIDNLGATIDPALLGAHLAHGGPLSVELVDKCPGDRGGGPVRWEGRPILCEEFRLPPGFDAEQVPVFNTNTFLVDARALDELQLEWTWVQVEKSLGEHKAVQFERLLGELTVGLPAAFLRVPREGEASRFLPVKDVGELERRRPELQRVLSARGLLTSKA
jgi:UTP--glucose-1-phosphate uridylyltransferase